jgi:hypothetical protein
MAIREGALLYRKCQLQAGYSNGIFSLTSLIILTDLVPRIRLTPDREMKMRRLTQIIRYTDFVYLLLIWGKHLNRC